MYWLKQSFIPTYTKALKDLRNEIIKMTSVRAENNRNSFIKMKIG